MRNGFCGKTSEKFLIISVCVRVCVRACVCGCIMGGLCVRVRVYMFTHCIQGDRGKYTAQKKEAQKLMEKAGLKDGPCGLAEFPKLQEALDGAFQLKVYNANRGLSLIYEGSTTKVPTTKV
ncbi:MAG: hypothetical protein GY820_32315, partial [Gammaproteobacteria bacterium]|nr:hypothetical protein [Gammaproteobacteria bacterium]